jgi:hypothetical protein
VSDTLQKLYLKAATIEPRKKTYFIGPYGKRVSFASQQQRALNTVWALHDAKEIKQGTRAAVIGAGLCGLTTVAALLAKKCLVYVYDVLPDVLEFQARASHRFVHPTINFWPEAAIRPTTQFPFFDWFESICSANNLRLREEWKSHFRDLTNRVYLESEVTAVVYDPDSGKVKVSATGGSAPPIAEYDIAIVATGFGAEETVTGVRPTPYWEPDFLSRKAQEIKDIVVSGTGDGGLVDALRAAHSHFEDGRLVIKLAQHLDDTGIKELIKKAEEDVPVRAGGSQEAAAPLFAEIYDQLASDMPPICERILTKSYYRAEPVTLIGPLSHPYTLNAAPIHKFMIAHAIISGQISYKQGRLVDGPWYDPKDGPREEMTSAYCIVRHGPALATPLSKLVSPAELDELKQTQVRIADLIDPAPYTSAFWALRGYPRQEVTSRDFIQWRFPLAATYSIEKYRRPIGVRFDNDECGYVMRSDGVGPAPAFVPNELFGIRLMLDEEIANDYAD